MASDDRQATVPRIWRHHPREWPDMLARHIGRWAWLSWHLIGRPRSYYTPDEIHVVDRADLDVRLMAHELGHHLGKDHPRPWELGKWLLNVMGYGLRVRDPHGLVPLAREAWDWLWEDSDA